MNFTTNEKLDYYSVTVRGCFDDTFVVEAYDKDDAFAKAKAKMRFASPELNMLDIVGFEIIDDTD